MKFVEGCDKVSKVICPVTTKLSNYLDVILLNVKKGH